MSSKSTKVVNKGYQAQATIKILVSIPVRSIDLAGAVAQASDLKMGDFIDILGDNLDYDFRITGVYEDEPL